MTNKFCNILIKHLQCNLCIHHDIIKHPTAITVRYRDLNANDIVNKVNNTCKSKRDAAHITFT